jgi:flagellin-specific chaperone FliS
MRDSVYLYIWDMVIVSFGWNNRGDVNMNKKQIAQRIRTIDEQLLQPFLHANLHADVDKPIRDVADELRDLWYEIMNIKNPFIEDALIRKQEKVKRKK